MKPLSPQARRLFDLVRDQDSPDAQGQARVRRALLARIALGASIQGIGGAVVGLFNNFAITKGASIPPLAIAFLVGYGVDVFFAFLEGMLQTFTRSAPSPSRPAQPDAK